jgi:hypothetical protein
MEIVGNDNDNPNDEVGIEIDGSDNVMDVIVIEGSDKVTEGMEKVGDGIPISIASDRVLV